jgi:hypothetical protein
MIDRIHPSHRQGERIRLVQRACNDLADTHGPERRLMRKVPDQGSHDRATGDERFDHRFARLAGGAGDQDHE